MSLVLGGYNSIAKRVLEIPEILELVFSFLHEQDNRSNVSVCKRWSDIALDALWREVNEPHRLFRLLSPLSENSVAGRHHTNLTYESFTKPLNAEDWKRFARYARRVRKLAYSDLPVGDEVKTTIAIGQAVFDEIARTRTMLNVLPHLQSLKWVTSFSRFRTSLMFMHENVKEFAILLHNSPQYPIGDFFEEVAERMPHLTYLDLRFRFSVRQIESELIALIYKLQDLSKVVLPLYCQTSKVATALSTLPSLSTIQFEFDTEQGFGVVEDVQHFAPMLKPGAFTSLVDLSLSAHLVDMIRFLKGVNAPTNLTSLYVHVLAVGPPSLLTEFLETAAEHCGLLTDLFIDAHPTRELLEATTSFDGPRETLSFEAIRPILLFPRLTSFELQWDLPMRVAYEEIEELASKWTTLEKLLLNVEPILFVTAHEPLTLRALVPFAQHCPNLRELGLLLTATTADLGMFAQAQSPPFLQPFPALQRLSFGLSSIAEAGPVAIFLSHLCPLGCEISSGLTWFDALDQAEPSAPTDELARRGPEWYARWAEVDRVLPLLVRLRMEERARRRAMERELEDLRVRCRVLEERGTLRMAGDATCLIL